MSEKKLDVEAIRARWASRSLGPMTYAYAGVDIAALIAEVEHQRDRADTYAKGWRELEEGLHAAAVRVRTQRDAAVAEAAKLTHAMRAAVAALTLNGDERHAQDILVSTLNQEIRKSGEDMNDRNEDHPTEHCREE